MLEVTDTMDAIKRMVTVFTILLAALITVLMERSFIVKEQGEIALMKAIGLRNGKIYAYHTLRFVFIGSMTVISAELFALPLTHLFIDPIFKMMGMDLAVDYVINPFEIRGSGLGLYICRQLMRKMNGEIFAKIDDDIITVTAVFTRA